MSNEQSWLPEFYEGLRLLKESYFPKTCNTCGKVYATMDEFIAQTDKVDHPTGLMEGVDEAYNPTVALFRNCPCGSSLMIQCRDRRDTSEEGERRRAIFQKLLDTLQTTAGIEEGVARDEILQLLEGRESQVLQRFRNAACG